MCVGPYLPNQKFMMSREYLDIYNFQFLQWKLPLDIKHPKYERDLSLVNFYLSLLEGREESIKNTFSQKISPKEVEEYIKNLLCLLAAEWNMKDGELEKIIKNTSKKLMAQPNHWNNVENGGVINLEDSSAFASPRKEKSINGLKLNSVVQKTFVEMAKTSTPAPSKDVAKPKQAYEQVDSYETKIEN